MLKSHTYYQFFNTLEISLKMTSKDLGRIPSPKAWQGLPMRCHKLFNDVHFDLGVLHFQMTSAGGILSSRPCFRISMTSAADILSSRWVSCRCFGFSNDLSLQNPLVLSMAPETRPSLPQLRIRLN